MYKYYYVNTNAQANGDHEVHAEGCSFIPSNQNRRILGYYNNCQDALNEAKRLGYTRVDGCYWCANACHRS